MRSLDLATGAGIQVAAAAAVAMGLPAKRTGSAARRYSRA
jgi:hypothetical protein